MLLLILWCSGVNQGGQNYYIILVFLSTYQLLYSTFVIVIVSDTFFLTIDFFSISLY